MPRDAPATKATLTFKENIWSISVIALDLTFIIEGLLQSVFGALFSYGLLLLLINGINSILSDWVSVQLTIAFFLPLWLIVISIIIGFIGSYKALSKFL